jgi:hypothetical protein
MGDLLDLVEIIHIIDGTSAWIVPLENLDNLSTQSYFRTAHGFDISGRFSLIVKRHQNKLATNSNENKG